MTTTVPDYAETFVITDELESVLKFVSEPIVKINGEVIEGIAKVDGQLLIVIVPDVPNRAGQKIEIAFDAQIKEGTSQEELSKYEERKIPNDAKYVIDNKIEKQSKPVTVTPPEPTNPDVAKEVKRASEAEWGTHKNLGSLDEVYSYRIVTTVPDGATAFLISDVLDELLAYAGNIKVEIDGEDVTSKTMTIEVAEAVEETEADKAEEATEAAEEKDATEEVTEAAEEKDATEEAAEEDATEEPTEEPAEVNEVPAEDANDEATEETAANTEGTEEETAQEEGETSEEDSEEGTEEGTEEETKSEEVPTEPQKTVIEKEINIVDITTGQTIVVKMGPEAVAAYEGKTIVVTFDAKICVDDKALVAKYANRTVPNTATIILNDDPSTEKESTPVTVTPPTPPTEEPKKAINGQPEAKLNNRNEIFTYTVTQVIPNGATEVVFTDTLRSVLEVVGVPTVNAEGFDVKVEGNVVTAKIADAKALWGEEVTLTINAKFVSTVTDAKLIELGYADLTVPNEATVTVDDKPLVTNKVLVTPPPEVIEIPVVKEWDDAYLGLDNFDRLRPDSITVTLFANGVAKEVAQITESNDWTYVFTNLNKVDAEGNEIVYSVVEQAVDYYYAVQEGDAYSGFVIKNLHRPWIPEIPKTPGSKFAVKKTVSGEAETDIPYVIYVKFTAPEGKTYANNQTTFMQEIQLKANEEYTFEYVEVGTVIEVTEKDYEGYVVTYITTVDKADGSTEVIQSGSFTTEATNYNVVINNHKNPKTPPTPPVPQVPKTGDENRLMSWIVLMGLVLAMMVAIAIRRRITK